MIKTIVRKISKLYVKFMYALSNRLVQLYLMVEDHAMDIDADMRLVRFKDDDKLD